MVFRKDEKRPELDIIDIRPERIWNSGTTTMWLRNYSVRVGTPTYE